MLNHEGSVRQGDTVEVRTSLQCGTPERKIRHGDLVMSRRENVMRPLAKQLRYDFKRTPTAQLTEVHSDIF